MASHNYSPLSNLDDQSVEIDSELNSLLPSADFQATRSSPSHKVISVTPSIFYLGFGAVVSIVINLILLYIHVSSSSSPLYSTTSQVSLRDLKYSSQYIGLDRVTQSANNSTYRRPLHRINYPDVLVQITTRNSARRYPHIVNQTSNFLISNEVRSTDGFLGISYSVAERSTTTQLSTIAQFRAADYGLTRCSIGSVVPSLRDLANTTKIYNSAGDPQGLHVDVWKVAFDGELNRNTISLGQRSSLSMSRQDKLATFSMGPGSKSRTPYFPCTSGGWYTFEFTASSESKDFGEVALRQDQALPTLGIYMRQKEP
ncbi:hypothetical protein PILCRDRAFT_15677 [Piloderma croceum F 1598]|uniref:Ubiquitin 3 binding protein But2 C-terminal domain-containing protein n=1 Tax=Piloderma croceum (strain F 1598) TaxID=765440 RepID=A0A0C3AGK8_PILCF|nr:hypothetical protein PILCRDRAFT_15677 [Piloderma croceum F 1598]